DNPPQIFTLHRILNPVIPNQKPAFNQFWIAVKVQTSAITPQPVGPGGQGTGAPRPAANVSHRHAVLGAVAYQHPMCAGAKSALPKLCPAVGGLHDSGCNSTEIRADS